MTRHHQVCYTKTIQNTIQTEVHFMNMDFYNKYEMLDNNDTQAYRMGVKLLADFKAVSTNQAKTIRKIMIQYIYDAMHGKTQANNTDEFYTFFSQYEEEKRTKQLAFKLPSKLLEDFKAVTPNQSKTLRLLLIEYIYKHQQQQ